MNLFNFRIRQLEDVSDFIFLLSNGRGTSEFTQCLEQGVKKSIAGGNRRICGGSWKIFGIINSRANVERGQTKIKR